MKNDAAKTLARLKRRETVRETPPVAGATPGGTPALPKAYQTESGERPSGVCS